MLLIVGGAQSQRGPSFSIGNPVSSYQAMIFTMRACTLFKHKAVEAVATRCWNAGVSLRHEELEVKGAQGGTVSLQSSFGTEAQYENSYLTSPLSYVPHFCIYA